jgi:cytoskeletal protein RodZ
MAHTGLGSYLREVRERAGMTLDELARRTRIRRQNLESLERGDWEALPSELYVRGFVKLVCREFGLSPETALRLYEESRREAGSPEETVWAEERTVPEPGWLVRVLEQPERVLGAAKRAGTWAAWGVGGAVVLLLALWVSRQFEGEAEPERTGRRIAAEQALSAGAERPEQAPAQDEDTELVQQTLARAEDAEPPERESPAAVETPARTQSATEQAEIRSELSGVRKADAEPSPAMQEERVIEGSRPAAGERLTLRIETVREVRISLLLDGVGHPRRRTLARGEVRTWKADSLFLLSTEDAGALRLTVAGEDLGPAGADGERLERVAIRASRP